MVTWRLPQEQYMRSGIKLGVIVWGGHLLATFAKDRYETVAVFVKNVVSNNSMDCISITESLQFTHKSIHLSDY